MPVIPDLFKKYSAVVQLALLLFASILLVYQISRPLVDYDEATYAKVVVDTMRTGDLSTLQLSRSNWFEKPPLYFWLSMGSVASFGDHEFSFRLPSILLSLLCLWLAYQLAKELSGDDLLAACTFLVLLTSKLFLMYAREARTDQGMLLAILAALYFFIKSWKNRRYLFWIFPAIAIGFLFKSIVALLAIPVIIIYAAFYKRWSWLADKYLWGGLLTSLVLIAPWHLLETIRFGRAFWSVYIVRQVFDRATTTITGTNNPIDYVRYLAVDYKPWMLVILAEIVLVLIFSFSRPWREKMHLERLLPPLTVAIGIVALFTLARTHLPTYIFPAFPFFAMFAVFSYRSILEAMSSKIARILFGGLTIVIIAIYLYGSIVSSLNQVPPATYDEMAIGEMYKNDPSGKIFSAGWPMLETADYYGDTQIMYLSSSTASGKFLKAPVYFLVGTGTNTDGFEVLYQGKTVSLLYSDRDVQLPNY